MPAPAGIVRDLHKHNQAAEAIAKGYGRPVLDFLARHVPVGDDRTCLMATNNIFNVYSLSDNYFKSIVNLCRANDIYEIYNFFRAANGKLPDKGLLVGCVETKDRRKARILRKYPRGIAEVYYFFDFVLKRIFPKLPVTRKIYYKITAGRNRVLSRTETIGRLYAAGFSLVEERVFGNLLFFVAEKAKAPAGDFRPSSGPLCRMRRIGLHGRLITVYKLRTMHPFAEHLQSYVYEKNALQEGGKFKDDFRISTLGRLLRKYWIDEWPMVINLLRGDVKLVGVRPLSPHYLGLYSETFKQRRLGYKPGLIPPFYADLPRTLEEIMASEARYLDAWDRAPLKTDFLYLCRAFRNIVFKRVRSK
jgi:lipopolysaccharide/colanic/teichoic acid biosynthesis glycosyltransferase